jgi:hypothetical protein
MHNSLRTVWKQSHVFPAPSTLACTNYSAQCSRKFYKNVERIQSDIAHILIVNVCSYKQVDLTL